MPQKRTIAAAVLFAITVNGFTLYPSMNATAFGNALGINSDCLTALNTTFNCDQATFAMAGDIHSYQWEQDDLKALCTSDCTDAAKKWEDDVVSKCDGQQININAMMVPVDTVAGRYVDGLGVACLQSSNSSFCMLESQDWVGSDYIQSGNTSDPENSRMANLYNDDVLCSDCFVKMLHQRLSSPYLPVEDHSEYLIEQFQDIQDVCTTTFQPALTTRATPTYTPVPTATPTASGNGTSANDTMPYSNGTCPDNGQLIRDPTKKRSPYPYAPSYAKGMSLPKWARSNSGSNHYHARSNDLHVRASAGNTTAPANNTGLCDQYSLQYGVATGDLQDTSGTDDCSGICNKCVSAKCDVKKVPAGASCDSLAEMFSTSTFNITTYQFLSWNPRIIGLCDSLQEGQYVCAGPPGGAYEPIDSPLGGNASAPVRGGPGSSGAGGDDSSASASASSSASTITDSAFSSVSVSASGSVAAATGATPTSGGATQTAGNSATPSATQSGIISGCKKFVAAKQGDNCVDFAKANNVDAQKFYDMNKILNGGKDCGTMFQTGDNYCVEA